MLIGSLALLGCFSPEETPKRAAVPTPVSITAGRTNVVLVLLDTVRADHLGLYGYDLPTSPHLDAFAADSVVFEQHIANCSWTRPSMGSLLTGQYARTLGLYEERYDRLPERFDLLSEHFQRKGYRTLGVTSNPNMNDTFGFVQGFDDYGESGVVFKWMPRDDKSGKTLFNKAHPLEDAATMTDRALALVDANADHLVKAEQPFYLQVVYIDPHWPYEQPEAHEDAVEGSKKPGYDGGIHFVDAELKRLMDGLEERGHLQDTLVIVTGDHGEGLASHPGMANTAWHGNTLYDSVLHIPFVVNHPTLKPRRVPEITEGLDLVPTVLGLFGWSNGESLPGIDLSDTLTTEASPPAERIVFSETDFRENRKYSARSSTHKWIRNADVALFETGRHEGAEKLSGEVRRQLSTTPIFELYALGSEQRRRVLSPSISEGEQLARALATWEANTPLAAPEQHTPDDVTSISGRDPLPDTPGEAVELDPATREALKAIGYLEE